MKKIQLEQGSADWLDHRKSRVGASEVASILCLADALTSRNELLRQKAFGDVKEVNSFTQRMFDKGHTVEAIVRLKLSQYNFEQSVFEHPTQARLFASLDGYDESKKLILEVKNTDSPGIWSAVREGNIPARYVAQAQTQLMCVPDALSVLLVVCKDNEQCHFDIFPDADYQSKIMSAVEKFLVELDQQKQIVISESDELTARNIALLKIKAQELTNQLKVIDDSIKFESSKLVEKYKATRIENQYLKIEQVERAGSIDYSKIPELASVDLEKYRKKPTKYFKVSVDSDKLLSIETKTSSRYELN